MTRDSFLGCHQTLTNPVNVFGHAHFDLVVKSSRSMFAVHFCLRKVTYKYVI